VQLVDDVTNSARKSIDVVNTAQDNAIAALRGSSKIIDSSSMLSVEAINGLTKNTENALTLSSHGLTTITASVGVLNEFLTTNKTTLSNLVGGPIEIANQVTTGINSLLKIVLVSPINAIIKRLEAYGKRKEIMRDFALKKLQSQNELDMHQLEIDKINAMIELARVTAKKREELSKLMLENNPNNLPTSNSNADLVPIIKEIQSSEQNKNEVKEAIEVRNEIENPGMSGGRKKRKKHTKKNKRSKKRRINKRKTRK